MKQKLITGDEYDVVSKYWRQYSCYLQRPGVCSKIKRGMRRRLRIEARRDIREGRFE